MAWSRLCCSLNKGYATDKAGASDADLYVAGQDLRRPKRGCRDGYEVGSMN